MPGRSAARAFAAAAHLYDQPHAAVAASRQRRPLDTFFPFDPYLLRRSATQLELKRSYIKCAACGRGSCHRVAACTHSF
jgi:hypothetical protein